MSRHRASEDVSADYNIRESVYLEVAKKGKNEYYRMNGFEKDCLDTFQLAKANHSIFGESNFDINGKCLDIDEKGREIPMGDGVIAQIERYCSQFRYNTLSSAVLDDVLSVMREKSDRPTGNKYVVMCNEKMWDQFGQVMKSDYRFNAPADATFLYSKDKGGDIKTGASFDSYIFQKNQLTFIPDRALSQEYPDAGYGIFLDTTADLKSGKPNIASFTVEGSEMVEGTEVGLGGADGKTSGQVSSGVHGSVYHLLGYSATVVFNPYKSFILKENVATNF